MIIRLELENFWSFRDRQVVDLRVPRTTPVDAARFAELPFHGGIRVPKVVSFFGPNASGKTTLLRAIAFLLNFIVRSFESNKPGEGTRVQPFASSRGTARKTALAIEFCEGDGVEGQPLYRYELELSNEGRISFVSFESLKQTRADGHSTNLFKRNVSHDGGSITVHPTFGIKSGDPRLEVRNNVSLISSLVQFGHKPSEDIISVIKTIFHRNIYIYKFSYSDQQLADLYGEHPVVLDLLNQLIKRVDLGIKGVEIAKVGESNLMLFEHAGLDQRLAYFFESQGTKNFVSLFPNLMRAIASNGIAVLDEIDSDLHPAIVPEVMGWFRKEEVKAQLWMTCQNPTLLHDLVKGEIWFVEKTEKGASSVYPLSRIHGVRRDTNLYSKYISGDFGALPKIG